MFGDRKVKQSARKVTPGKFFTKRHMFHFVGKHMERICSQQNWTKAMFELQFKTVERFREIFPSFREGVTEALNQLFFHKSSEHYSFEIYGDENATTKIIASM